MPHFPHAFNGVRQVLPEGTWKRHTYASSFLTRLFKSIPPCPFQLKLMTVQDLARVNHWGSVTQTPEIKAQGELARNLTCQWRSNPAQWIYHNRQVRNSRAPLQQRCNIFSYDWLVKSETGFFGRSGHHIVPPCHLGGERVWRSPWPAAESAISWIQMHIQNSPGATWIGNNYYSKFLFQNMFSAYNGHPSFARWYTLCNR